MRAVIQRVTQASVSVDGKTVGSIQKGLMVLLGVKCGDTERDADYMADKIIKLRIFEDENGKMNRAVREVQGGILCVSQFTLLGGRARAEPSRIHPGGSAGARQYAVRACLRAYARTGRRLKRAFFARICRCRWSMTGRSRCCWTAKNNSDGEKYAEN